LDLLRVQNKEGALKLQIYGKPTHTDQHLNFSSHHPIEHKLSVVRTLLERSQSLVSEDAHIEKALRSGGYPERTFWKVRGLMMMKTTKKKQKNDSESLRPIVLPYAEGTSERVARVMKRHRMLVTMKPVKTLRRLLLHPRTNKKRKKSWTVFTKFLVAVVRRLT